MCFQLGYDVVAMDESSIARNIKSLRLSKKISLEELGKLTGLTRGYLSKVERSHKAPPLSTLNKIALTLGVDVTSFLKDNTEKVEDTEITVVRRNKGKKVVTKGLSTDMNMKHWLIISLVRT